MGKQLLSEVVLSTVMLAVMCPPTQIPISRKEGRVSLLSCQ